MAKDPEQDAAEDTPQPAAAPKAAAAPRAGMFMVILFGFVMMVSTPLITYFVVKATVNRPPETLPEKPKEGDDSRPPRPTPETIVNVDPVVMNIDGTQGTRYLKLAVHLVTSEARLALELDDASRKSLITDRIIAAAGSKTISELEGARGRENVKGEIMQRLNKEFGGKMHGTIIDVYFSEYLIQ